LNRRSASLAAVLSFLWPGLGHAYLGRRRAALAFALPVVLATAAILIALVGDLDSLLGYLITPSGSMTVLVLVLLVGAWRVIAMVDAVAIARRIAGLRRGAMALTGVLLAVILASHAAVAYTAYTAYDASSKIFVGDHSGDATPTPIPSGPLGSGMPSPEPSDEFNMTPNATPQTA